jgi:hypothetical protein
MLDPLTRIDNPTYFHHCVPRRTSLFKYAEKPLN